MSTPFDWSESPQRCLECGEPICEHGICWCDDADGFCGECDDREEAAYQAEQNAKYYAREDNETF